MNSTANLTWINPRFRAFWASPAAAFAVPLRQGQIVTDTLTAAQQAGVLILLLVFLIAVVGAFTYTAHLYFKNRAAVLAAQPKPPTPEAVATQLSSVNGIIDVLKMTESNRVIELEQSGHRDTQIDKLLNQIASDREYQLKLRERVDNNEAAAMRNVQEQLEAQREETAAKKALAKNLDAHKDSVDEALGKMMKEAKAIRASLGDLPDEPNAKTVREILSHVPRLVEAVEALPALIRQLMQSDSPPTQSNRNIVGASAEADINIAVNGSTEQADEAKGA